jgi:hypothetical protein
MVNQKLEQCTGETTKILLLLLLPPRSGAYKVATDEMKRVLRSRADKASTRVKFSRLREF